MEGFGPKGSGKCAEDENFLGQGPGKWIDSKDGNP